jgi:diguanylate cyclase (GGDEF)-like protein
VTDGKRRGRFEDILSGQPAPAPLEDVRRCKDGSSIHVQTTLSAVRDEDGKILFISCIMRDVTERMKAEQHIEQLATKDALTGLSNRSMLMEQMSAAIARAARSHTHLVVMFVDLDHFKSVNDTLGHAAGDDLLRECAKRLTECVREVDIVARLGGDEFVVLLTDVADTAIVTPIADRMLKLLTTPYHLLGHDAQTSASIGICFYPADGKDVTTLMKYADIAMYHAKELNRNNYQFYAEEMNQRMLRRQQLERELRSAVENNEFVLHYQPQVVVATGEIQGAESLIRWQHPTRGLLPPAEFIAVAEETGLIVPMGEWILHHACRTIKAWRANGVGIPYIVVNISAAQLGEGLVQSVRQALVEHEIEPGWLMLEITETMLMERVEQAISILRRIRELGIRIAMDDFGTGYSSLSILQRLPLDALKIDRSFVSAIDDEANNARACAIIGAIVAIAKELNLSVVAEGVETTTQLAFLRTVNCDTYQGFLYSEPVDTMTLEVRYATPARSVLEDKDGHAITMTTKVTLELPFNAL